MDTDERAEQEDRTEHEDHAVAQVVDRLVERYPDRPRSFIEDVVTQERHLLDGKPIRDYVPVLVEHGAKAQLRRSTGHGPVHGQAPGQAD